MKPKAHVVGWEPKTPKKPTRPRYPVSTALRKGLSKPDLIRIAFSEDVSLNELKKRGITAADLKAAKVPMGKILAKQLDLLRKDPHALESLHDLLVSEKMVFGIRELLEGGYTVQELLDVEYPEAMTRRIAGDIEKRR